MGIYDSDENGYPEVCLMTPEDAKIVFSLIQSDTRFSQIGIIVNLDRNTYSSFPLIPEGTVPVIFKFPYEGVKPGDFHGELCKVLTHHETTPVMHGERER